MSDDIVILNVNDVAKILGVHPNTARKIFKYKYFPRIKGTNKLLVEKESFLKFIRSEEYKYKV